ncbi:hypothetical protein QOZ80_5AG0396240 [Eleusine coracana subsp. coracana]|nr:hypothetical protein QOZ80_5AG0396240 [Eleusine coracana subsp. coracana]
MMVGKGCDSCSEWQEHYYWKHMDVTKISFFKVMTGDFAKGISIPEKFVRNFKITEEAVDLKVTSGETWHIGLEKHGSELYLMSGWVDFIKAQDLQENDILIFTCNSHSSFSVLIFEEIGCMKVSSLFAPNMCRNFNDMDGQHAEHYSLSDSDDTRMPSQCVGSPHDACVSKKSSGREPHSLNSRSCHVKDEAMEDESDDIYDDSKYYYSRVANRLTDDEKDKILCLAPIGRDNPVFVTVLQKAHCRHRNNTLVSYSN